MGLEPTTFASTVRRSTIELLPTGSRSWIRTNIKQRMKLVGCQYPILPYGRGYGSRTHCNTQKASVSPLHQIPDINERLKCINLGHHPEGFRFTYNHTQSFKCDSSTITLYSWRLKPLSFFLGSKFHSGWKQSGNIINLPNTFI